MMGNKLSYSEKLHDPRWQKKRLKILERDNWTCQSCEGDDEELHVHHISYMTDNPWEEEDDNLITLCGECHKTWHVLYDSNLYPEYVYSVVSLYNKLEQQAIDKWCKENPTPGENAKDKRI